MILRIFSKASFHCNHCGADSNFYRSPVAIFERWCQCPICHTHNVKVRSRVDRIDRMSPNPLRRALWLLGCPLYHCTFCRYQFRDWRGLDPQREGCPADLRNLV